ncbi:ArnT family glycosyltransferase [Nocardia sp. KC 131]|uniref:ArnT family glycosyltransferase n=1 Tax=Nocardia arseniciresistens TaxID=3392119 RepID=UPI00398F1BF4
MTEAVAPITAARRAPSIPERPDIRRERLALAGLLIGTAGAYFWNLTASGWGNDFYAAAVQSGAISWKAFFFGSLDPGNIVTVDKTPLSLWPMELSARIFGFSSWSMLMPQVLLGIASVAFLWATVRRHFGATAGLLAGLTLALTPVAALMFRFNDPDAMLTFLTLAAAWAMSRALADGRWRWLVLTGVCIGFGFLAKQLQVMLVVPGLGMCYLVAGPPRLVTRIVQLCTAGAALVVSAGWWVLIAQLWPTDSRPYFGGSKDNSILDLTVGYNGIQRLNSDGFGPRAGSPGITRLFQPELAGQITWLLPAALVLLLIGLVLRAKAPRTDGLRAMLLLWGGWLVVSGLVFSFMTGTFHQYYTLTMAPAVAALIGGGGMQAWRARERPWVRTMLALSVALTVATAWLVLARTPDFFPWLRWIVLVVGAGATVVLIMPLRGKSSAVAALAALCVGLAGPVAYTADTLANSHGGGGTAAGPQVAGNGRFGGSPGAAADRPGQPSADRTPGGAAADANPPSQPPAGPTPGVGGFGTAINQQIVTMLQQNAGAYTWPGAAVSSHAANGYQLAGAVPVMAIGGFSGGDPAPTVEQFQQYVRQGRIHYFIGGNRGGRDNDSEGSKITTWVQQHYAPTTMDGVTVYDLTAPMSS